MDAVISLLTDFGTSDTSVGQCKGVIAAIAPKAIVVDLSHGVPHYDIAAGSWMLRSAVVHFPIAIHVAVVDPGVGTARRPIGLVCGRGDILIGPDNGLLLDAGEALGGIVDAVELTDSQFWHHPVSSTFHARDIFSPCAAHLAHRVGIHSLGQSISMESLIRLPTPGDRLQGYTLQTMVRMINEYGTLALASRGDRLRELGHPRAVSVQVGDLCFEAVVARTFGEASVGQHLLFVDSYSQLSLAINQSDLARELGLERSERPTVLIEPLEVLAGKV